MNIASFLCERPSSQKLKFVEDYASIHDIDKKQALDYITSNGRFVYLTNKWYEYLDAGNLKEAYDVYNDDYYFTDLWNCYQLYSRRYLRSFYKTSIDSNHSIMSLTKDANTVVDIGCGIGYTTSALTEMYPNAKVYGVNLKNTKQWTFCESMSKKYNFNMIESVDQIGDNVDVAFASEFFEHILDPLEYVTNVVKQIAPKYFIIANAFNTRSIGHFNTYHIDGGNTKIGSDLIGRRFNKTLVSLNYKKLKTTLYNNKPNVWKRLDD